MNTTTRPSIYRNQRAKLNALYQRAGDLRKVLCVAFDFAKSKHLALCCDGNGDILRKSFPVQNNRDGINFLIERIEATASRRKIPKNQVFHRGEDEPPYVSNFLAALREKGYLVMRVNAFHAKHKRSDHRASTDEIDLLGIAHTLISRRARDTEPAAGIAGELGPPDHRSSLERLCSYAGIVPRTYQSGGPDKPAVQGHVGPRCNRILKDRVVQSAQKLRLYEPPEIKDRIIRWNNNGQHGTFAEARRYLRLMRSLTRNGVPYLTPAGRARNADPKPIAESALASWEVMAKKWRTIPVGLDLITDEIHPIGFWRQVICEIHGIKLPTRG